MVSYSMTMTTGDGTTIEITIPPEVFFRVQDYAESFEKTIEQTIISLIESGIESFDDNHLIQLSLLKLK